MTPSEKQALIATRATLLVFQHAVESGMVESDLKMAYQLAEAAIDKADTALAADAVAEQGQGWQPIETAPKDGTRLLLWWGGSVAFAKWLDNSKCQYPWAGWQTPSLTPRPSGDPTHWMPLPPPPHTMPTPQPEFDLTTLITNGAKAWAGVNAQDLREGKPVGEPPAEALGESQPKPLGWYCVSAYGMAALCFDKDDAQDSVRQADALYPRVAPHRAVQLCEYQEAAPADQLPDAGKMAAALRAIADGTVNGGNSQSHLATVLAYQELARKTLETDAERMAGARAKHDDTYPGDLLARMENEPK